MLSTVLTTSTRGVVIGIENRTQNVDKSRNEYLLPSQDSIRAGTFALKKLIKCRDMSRHLPKNFDI